MTELAELWDCERGFWLDGSAHYDRHLAPDARMVFPEPAGMLDVAQIMQGLDGAPRWDAVEFDAQHISRHGDTVVLSYAATGQRQGSAPYRALWSSTYARQGDDWKLLMHQHTLRD